MIDKLYCKQQKSIMDRRILTMAVSKTILRNRIRFVRRKMYRKAKILGFTHPETVACSQTLDGLLNRYQNIA
ncbi:Spo0E family sporulation regulatory protein-aspartic acid phosphatase [Bhargavaea ullalensis]